jgi:hypothetical protein
MDQQSAFIVAIAIILVLVIVFYSTKRSANTSPQPGGGTSPGNGTSPGGGTQPGGGTPPAPPACDPALCKAPGGSCTSDGKCDCNDNYTGENCQTLACSSNNCNLSGADCVKGSCICRSEAGWTSSGGSVLCDVCAPGRGPGGGDCSKYWLTLSVPPAAKDGLNNCAPSYGCYSNDKNGGAVGGATPGKICQQTPPQSSWIARTGGVHSGRPFVAQLCNVTGWYSSALPSNDCDFGGTDPYATGLLC